MTRSRSDLELSLRRHDVSVEVAERIHADARAAFRVACAPVALPRDLWTRVFEPAFVVASVVLCLAWTTRTLVAIHAEPALGQVSSPR
jgi:hypothetical protein